MNAKVAILMGSDSDLPIMQQAAEMLKFFGIEYTIHVISAHRAPDILYDFASNAHERGYCVIIAGAGGAAHLPGVIAGLSPLPVIGVPIKSSNSLAGLDSLLSIVQMPSGIPVATVAIDGAKNAAILAAQILSVSNKDLQQKIINYKKQLHQQVIEKNENLKNINL